MKTDEIADKAAEIVTEQQLAEYKLELLRQRVETEQDIARSLWKLVKLLERCMERSPWAMQLLAGVYAEEDVADKAAQK